MTGSHNLIHYNMGISERKEREKARRRNEIIDAAEEIFFKKGIESATMDEVAEQAELSKGTLYLYFNSKEELHFAINLRAMAILKRSFLSAYVPAQSGLENIRNIGFAYIEFAERHADHFHALMYFETKDTEHFLLENVHYRNMISEVNPMDVFMEVIRKGISDGSVRSDLKVHILAHNLWAMTTGILHNLSSPKLKALEYHMEIEIDRNEIINSVIEIIKTGIQR